MANELNTTAPLDPATDFSTLCSMPSALAVLDRAFDHSASFTPAEIALVEQIAAGEPSTQPVDERTIRQSIGTLAAAMPSQATGQEAGRLKLNAYVAMLGAVDERALAYACRRCLAELDWFPTVHQVLERTAEWVGPEKAAIVRARAILRSGRRISGGDDSAAPVALEEVRALRERAEKAARSLLPKRVEPVAFDTPGELAPHQMRIPNKGDYERLFGIDADSIRARAEAAQRDAEERDADLLRDAMDAHIELHRAA